MKRLFILASLTFALCVTALPIFGQKLVRPSMEYAEPTFNMLSPAAGTKITGGLRVTISWELTVDEALARDPWAEMELFLVDDDGLNSRITPQLGIERRSFDWIVPKINSRSARLVLWVGVAGEGDFYILTQAGSFSIRSKSAGPAVNLNTIRSVKAGEDLDISWTSESVDATRGFDVIISYDRGAHFFKAGTTTESRFAFSIDEDFSGGVTVKIIGRRSDGSKVTSILTPDATVMIKSKD